RPGVWEVVSVGVMGASPIYYAANLPRYLSLQPDAAMIMIFENDLYEDRLQESLFFTRPLLDNDSALFLGSTKRRLWERSRLYMLARRGWHYFTRSPLEKIVARNRNMASTPETQKDVSPFVVAPSQFDQQWGMTQAYLDYMVESLHRQHVAVFIT